MLDARHPTPVTAGGTSNLGVGEVAVLLDGSKSGFCRKLLAPSKEGTRSKKNDDDDDDEASHDEEKR